MALAPLVYTIWNRVMRFDPQDPIWPNRDRFVLSNGHASMLLWSVLHLAGVQAVNAEYERLGQPAVTLDDIRRFRQLGSKAPGAPEYHWVSGVETTTGPLGQGDRHQRRHGDRPEVARQALQPARLRRLRLQRLRGVRRRLPDGGRRHRRPRRSPATSASTTCAGSTTTITSRSRAARASPSPRMSRRASWATAGTCCASATPTTSIGSRMRCGSSGTTEGRPTLIILDSHIGYGSPHKQDTAAAHGEPLGEDEVRLIKRAYGWPEDAQFLVPDGVREHFAAGVGARGAEAHGRWTELFAGYRAQFPELATEIEQMQRRELPAGWDRDLPVFPADPKGIAGRDASGQVLNVLAQNVPLVPRRLGGSRARRTRPTLKYAGAGDFEPGTPGGKNLHFGIREHAMAAVRQRIVAVEAAALRRDLFHLQRLRAARDAALGADGAADHLRLHARRDGRRRGRARPTSRSSSSRRCARFPGSSRCFGPAMRTRWSRPIAASRSSSIAPAVLVLSRQASADAGPEEVRAGVSGSRAARTCSPTRRAARPR